MKFTQLEHKKIVLLGYGKEGQAAERVLRALVPSASVFIREVVDPAIPLTDLGNYDLAIRSPSVPPRIIPIPYTTGTNLFFANCTNTVIGITGSKGKTTTASLMYHILKEAGRAAYLVGNVGNPALLELQNPVPPDSLFVYELSSYQLEDCAYSPHIGIVVSVFPDHMDHHGSIDAYYNAKKTIIKFMNSDDYYLYNEKYPLLATWAKSTRAQALPFVRDIPLPDSQLPIIGEHNKDNVRAAVTAMRILGISDDSIARGVRSFVPVPHRLQLVGTYDGITFYDSAISVTPHSTMLDIQSFPNVGTIFLGGTDRGYDFSSLVTLLLEKKIPNIVLFPESGARILEMMKSKTEVLPRIIETSSMDEAVRFAYMYTPKGSVCLLSSASPSYSIWKNFEEKGDLFVQYVKEHATQS